MLNYKPFQSLILRFTAGAISRDRFVLEWELEQRVQKTKDGNPGGNRGN